MSVKIILTKQNIKSEHIFNRIIVRYSEIDNLISYKVYNLLILSALNIAKYNIFHMLQNEELDFCKDLFFFSNNLNTFICRH